MKRILNYVIIFTITVITLFFALVVSSMIPHSAIEGKLKESIEFYKKKSGIYKIKNKKLYSYIHYYADTRKLNIIYCLDSSNPIESTLWAKYYQEIERDTNRDFINLVEKSKEPNTQYLRYWNGCMLFLRPLLTLFNMEQIYLINQILLAILSLILFIMLLKKSKKLAFIFLSALILVSTWYATMCIECSVTFYILFIATMIAIKIDNNKNNNTKEEVNEKLSKLFLITGIVTTFFDFLTTELLTIFVPLLIILIIRKEENRLDSFKNVTKFVLKVTILWFIGYAGMWLAKWVLASLILQINAFEYVKDNFTLRFNGLQGLNNYEELYNHVIERNFFAIPLVDFISANLSKWEIKFALGSAIVFPLLFTNWKVLKNKKYLLIFIIIGIIPYIRYLILANHSFRHAMFTFRDQIITIMVLLYIIIECLNYKLLCKKITKDSFKQNDKNNNERLIESGETK